MNKLITIVSHLGTGSSLLCKMLGETQRIQFLDWKVLLDHPTTISKLMSLSPHKYSDSIGTYVCEVTENQQITHKGVYACCDFIFLTTHPRHAFQLIEMARPIDYYIFRLRRMYEMARDAGGVFVKDLGKGLPKLQTKLAIKEPLQWQETKDKAPIPKEVENAYELFLYRMNRLTMERQLESY